MKRTYKPSKIKKNRKHGFLKRMSNKKGRKIIKLRKLKKRKYL